MKKLKLLKKNLKLRWKKEREVEYTQVWWCHLDKWFLRQQVKIESTFFLKKISQREWHRRKSQEEWTEMLGQVENEFLARVVFINFESQRIK